MMFSTILLVANLLFLFFKENALFSFWNFVWIYPLEIFLWTLIGFSWFKFIEVIFND